MATTHGIAGEWARVKGAVLGLWPLALGIFFTGFSLALWTARGFVVAIPLLVASLVATGAALVAGLRRVERFYIGARGEEKVANILANLEGTYHVFNDFVAMGVHVDHVVVGPAGVFSIETKCWKGHVTSESGHIIVNGRLPSRPPVEQAQREAALVKTTLAKAGWTTGGVTSILAFASDTFESQPTDIQGVVVMNSSDLADYFTKARNTLSAGELKRLVTLIETLN